MSEHTGFCGKGQNLRILRCLWVLAQPPNQEEPNFNLVPSRLHRQPPWGALAANFIIFFEILHNLGRPRQEPTLILANSRTATMYALLAKMGIPAASKLDRACQELAALCSIDLPNQSAR